MSPILPPAMLGILGGGQLGRMFTVAAKTMGYKVTVLDPDQHAPAAEFADRHLCAPFDDEKALAQLAMCAGVTTEFENVDARSMTALATKTRVSPAGDVVAIAQDRILEKSWIQKAGLLTAPYAIIENDTALRQDFSDTLFPAVLKTARLGYDGKGQCSVPSSDALPGSFCQLGNVACVLEKRLDLHTEISVVITRLDSGLSTCFPVAENQHRNGILDISIVPARVSEALQHEAQQMAKKLADALDYVGVLTVELFVLADQTLVVNEIAPRPHNSGHYSLNASVSDQFQQQVRALCGLNPAQTDLLSPCVMVNILGDSWHNGQEPDWYPLLNTPNVHLHLYGKSQPRKGRKMGHFTVMAHETETALTTAQNLQSSL